MVNGARCDPLNEARQTGGGYDRQAIRLRRQSCSVSVRLLGSCGGASESGVSGYVADHWPHWAGGMPADVPPRPGAPGYNEFIAHGQPARIGSESLAGTTIRPPACRRNASSDRHRRQRKPRPARSRCTAARRPAPSRTAAPEPSAILLPKIRASSKAGFISRITPRRRAADRGNARCRPAGPIPRRSAP